jgi:hypothetical protein
MSSGLEQFLLLSHSRARRLTGGRSLGVGADILRRQPVDGYVSLPDRYRILVELRVACGLLPGVGRLSL